MNSYNYIRLSSNHEFGLENHVMAIPFKVHRYFPSMRIEKEFFLVDQSKKMIDEYDLVCLHYYDNNQKSLYQLTFYYHEYIHRKNGPAQYTFFEDDQINQFYVNKVIFAKEGKIHNDEYPAYYEVNKINNVCNLYKYYNNGDLLEEVQTDLNNGYLEHFDLI